MHTTFSQSGVLFSSSFNCIKPDAALKIIFLAGTLVQEFESMDQYKFDTTRSAIKLIAKNSITNFGEINWTNGGKLID